MKKICIAIFLMLVIPAFATATTTEDVNQDMSVSTNIVMVEGTEDEPLVVPLIADGGSEDTAFEVGYISVWDDEGLHIAYYITEEGWEMTLTHVHMGDNLDDFPLTKQGNPQVGKFDYQMAFEPPVTTYDDVLPYNGEIMIAVQAEVQTICGYEDEADLVGFEANLPDQVQFKLTYPVGGGPAYFPHVYINGLDDEQMDVYGWCVDTDHVIYRNTWYTANVYSGYETLPAGLIEHPENLDLVHWILNQHYVGQASPGCSGSYTYGDVQRAIWALVEDAQSTSGLGSWSQCRVDEILAAAYASGEGYTPGCGDTVAVVLTPVSTNQVIIAQVIIGEIELAPCIPIYCGETAWAQGTEFTEGKSWAMWFAYSTGENNPVRREINLKGLMQLIFARIARILETLRVT